MSVRVHHLTHVFSKKRTALGLPRNRRDWVFFAHTLCGRLIRLGHSPPDRRPLSDSWQNSSDERRCSACAGREVVKTLQEMP